MDLLEGLKQNSLTTACWWAASCVVFFVLTKFWPCNPGRNWWKNPRAAFTDLIYGVLLVPLTGLAGRIALLWVGIMIFYSKDATPEFTARGWPLWLQCVLILLIQDALMYWIHRLFHTRHGWGFHAIHHSPETLDWTAASRFHPVNEVGQYALVDAAVLLMGFSPVALAILVPFHTIYGALVHANLNWTFGPLRYILASPVFHRWHHSCQPEAIDKNFAPMFPFFDLMGGTFYMPRGVVPESYGANEPTLPAGPLGQTLFPFRGAGRWAYRHPAVALVCVLASAGAVYSFWQYVNRPTDIQTVATPASIGEEPPDLLPPTVLQKPKQTNVVVVNAISHRAFYGMRDGTISIRDIATGQELSLGHHKSRVNALAISPDAKSAVSASSDGTALVLNAESGEVRRALSQNGTKVACVSAAVSDDGWVAAGGTDGTIRLWDSQGRLAKQRHLSSTPINAIAISEGGRQVVASQVSQVSTWDVASDHLVKHQRLSDLAYCVGISRDGLRIAAGDYTGRLHLWDLGKEQPRRMMDGHTGPIYALWISRDGESVVTGGADNVVRVWNASSGALGKELHGHVGCIFSVSYDLSRQRILAGGRDGMLTSWDAPSDLVIPASGSQPVRLNN